MNRHIHTNPDAWQEIFDGWKLCLLFRDPRNDRIRAEGRIKVRNGTPVRVVHGSGRTLGPWVLSCIG
jgi:hypothetical protein